MTMTHAVEVVRNFYKAFAEGDRSFVEQHITDDFTFSAPRDPLLDREGYFTRCWPGAGRHQNFTITRIIEHENEIVVTYEVPEDDGSKGRNTEIFTMEQGKVRRVEVYFGWTSK